MLVLTRRARSGDASIIQIGNNIEITVVEIRGGDVRIGIRAPRDLPVCRRELYDELMAGIHSGVAAPTNPQSAKINP